MNATAMTRTIRFAWVLLLALLALGVLGAQEAGAEPNTGTNKTPSIASRVKSFEEHCEQLGGGTARINYSYVDGKLESANGSCKGGSESGYNCTYTAESTKCYQGPKKQARVVTTRIPVEVVLTDAEVVAEPGATTGEAVVVADPATTTGEVISVEPTLTDAGSPDATVDAAPVESTPAATEPVILVIEAEPTTVQLVEDDQE